MHTKYLIPHKCGISIFILIILLSFTINVSSEISNGDISLQKKLQNTNFSEIILNDTKLVNLNLNFNNNKENDDDNNETLVLINNDNVKFNLTNMIRLKDLLDVFSIGNLIEKWNLINQKFTKNCSNDVEDYFYGLNNRKMWAIKMDDATGHYTSGFFYGNNYWMGSLSLCKSIYKTEEDDDYQPAANGKGSSLPFAAAHLNVYNSIGNENPPFIPGFFILKMFVNDSIMTPVTRTIYVGVCLPSSCSHNDIRNLVTESQQILDKRQIDLLDIREPTNSKYTVWNDRTFWIILIISSIVFALMIAGTLYEIYLTRQFKEALREQDKEMNNSETSSGIGCASSDYSDSVSTELKDEFKKELKDLNIVLELPHNVNNNNSDEHLEGHLHEPEKLSVYSELLLSFSIITNFNAICDRTVGSDTIPSIHGLRAISMAWVILGHTCIVVFKYSDNMEMRKYVEKNFFFQAITNGPFSVDTFFFISGFLVSYIYFRTNAKGKLQKLSKGASEFTAGTYHFLGLVGYRFMRLTAPYLFVLGVVQVAMKYLETYSIFDPPTMDHITCPQYWWRNILYINTLFPVDEMCMLWSWYLANDTQFYIIGAIILIVGVRHFKLAASTMGVFLVSSWITTGIIAFNNNHKPNTDDPLALFDKIYDKPWTRLGPYLIGMGVGWILFKTNCKIRLTKTTVITAWTIALGNLLVLVFGLYRTELSQLTAAAYSSLSHSAWALSLAWITIACSTGYGGYVNSLLSAPCIYPFSRVTYCAYLVHPIVIRSMALNSDAPLHLGADSMVVTFFGLVVCSYLLSFVVSISFEAPVVTMLKILSPSRKKRIA